MSNLYNYEYRQTVVIVGRTRIYSQMEDTRDRMVIYTGC